MSAGEGVWVWGEVPRVRFCVIGERKVISMVRFSIQVVIFFKFIYCFEIKTCKTTWFVILYFFKMCDRMMSC